jgi:glucuronate isomerase
MPSTFIHADFLLETPRARALFHEFAEPLPILDFHCHLSPGVIAEDRRFPNLAEPWLEGDHYKWRAMRTCGVAEHYITGAAPPREKFQKWAETVPRTLRNPLYHWTHLELNRPFGINDRLLSPETAGAIWEECNAMLATPEFSARGILRRMGVAALCTTDDPVDSLEHHRRMAADPAMPARVYPTFRPDRAMAVDVPEAFTAYLGLLGQAASFDITSWASFLDALAARHAFFHEQGCRLSDHGLDRIYCEECSPSEAVAFFDAASVGRQLDRTSSEKLKSAILHELAVMDAEAGWVQQFHLGALRNANTRMRRKLGPDTGYDSIGDAPMAGPLARFLDRLDDRQKLAKTILYNLNPADNEVFASMLGNFQDGEVAGKMQYGPAWWFLDQREGMTAQLESLSAMGLLGQFVGMLTDSRSFLSYPRHEYFRRLLCNILGGDIHRGLLPDDLRLVGGMVRDICYFNAERFLDLPR